MNSDVEHLRLLSIFHYVVAALAVLFSLFPLLYAGMGTLFLWLAQHPGTMQNGEPPPPFIGWILIGLGSFGFLIGLTMAICVLIAGCDIARRRHYTFAFVIACIECLFFPFGTVLGVFTLIVLTRESVKALFNTLAE